MKTYREVFPKKHTLLVVVHVEDEQQALRNVGVAKAGGADGVFLINHHLSDGDLIRCYKKLIPEFSDFWIGLNCLDSGIRAIRNIPETCDGLWVDNAGIEEENSLISTTRAGYYENIRKRSAFEGLYFGGVAFKGQKSVTNVAEVARRAIPFADVITTSGVGTGFAPDVWKIRTMKEAIGEHPLAIASGITPENVHLFLRWADCFLVATGISDSHTELNLWKVKELSKILGK